MDRHVTVRGGGTTWDRKQTFLYCYVNNALTYICVWFLAVLFLFFVALWLNVSSYVFHSIFILHFFNCCFYL